MLQRAFFSAFTTLCYLIDGPSQSSLLLACLISICVGFDPQVTVSYLPFYQGFSFPGASWHLALQADFLLPTLPRTCSPGALSLALYTGPQKQLLWPRTASDRLIAILRFKRRRYCFIQRNEFLKLLYGDKIYVIKFTHLKCTVGIILKHYQMGGFQVCCFMNQKNIKRKFWEPEANFFILLS